MDEGISENDKVCDDRWIAMTKIINAISIRLNKIEEYISMVMDDDKEG